MFIDASALFAIVLDEKDADFYLQKLIDATYKITSATAVWETTVTLSRMSQASPAKAQVTVFDLCKKMSITIVPIRSEAAALAVDAFDRFGQGRHPAGLNFGDCFAYACARHHDEPLLYKGNDFGLTDIEAA